MKRRKPELYILTLLLLAAVLLCALVERSGREAFFFRAGEETIRVWEKCEGERYVFLPSYVNLNQLTIQTGRTQRFDDLVMKDGMDCGGLELDRPYALGGGGTITFLKSENLPALYLDTASGNLDYIHKKKGNRESGAMRLYRADGELDAAGKLKKIQARGNSTFYADKKPYSLTLTQKADLLGMGAAKNWILLTNAIDASHLKNKFVYDFAREAGLPFTPESRWVDLYLNGNYAGLYLLCERNEIAPGRVELPKNDGFLVSKEQLYNLETGDAPYFETDAGVYLRVRGNTLGQTRMERTVQSAENAILAPDGVDPVTGKHWRELINLDSWAGKYLIEEIFDGIDAGISSQFFFYPPGEDKLYAGPVWDYDDTMGAGIWLGGEIMMSQVPEIFYAHRANNTPWLHSLYYQKEFYNRATQLYREKFSDLLASYLDERLPAYTAEISTAARLNQIRWNTGDQAAAAEQVIGYLRGRMEFLNDAWVRDKKFYEVHVDFAHDEFGCDYAIFDYAVPPGGFLSQLPEIEGYLWYNTAADAPFDPGRPILEETSLELRQIG